MERKYVTVSTLLHLALFIAAMVSLPWLKRDFVIPEPVAVEFVEVSKVTQTDKPAPQPQPPEEKEEEKKEEPPAPPPPAENKAEEAAPPVKKPEKKEEKKEEKKKEKPVDENKKPEKKPEKKPDKAKAEEKEPDRDFASVLKNLQAEKPAPPSDKPAEDKQAAAAPGTNAPLGEKMTISEEDALRHQLEKCWNVPFGAKDAQNLVVDIFMVINPDRTLRDARIVDMARYRSDSFFRAAADSAVRAVRSPLCSPFELPPDKYDVWQTTTVTFDPSRMF